MTDKFQNYMNNIHEKNKFKLLLVPILIVTFIFILNQFLILLLIPFFNDNLKEILSFSGTSVLVNEALCFFLSLFLMTKISKLSTEQLGFTKNNIVISYLKGALFGILEISTVFLIILVLKAINIYFVNNITILTLVKIFIIFFFQGLLEEILFRGYLMPMFSKVIGVKLTIIVLSTLFTCVHLFNPNLDIIGLLNVFLAGVTFSLIYYYTGNLWIVGAMHTFWNFILGYVVGSQVSGIVTYKSIFFSIPVENKDLISGGAFGFEASIIVTIVQIAITLFVIYLIRKNNKLKGEFVNKEIFDLVEKIFSFLKIEDYNKLKSVLNIIEKDYPNYYKIFEKFKNRSLIEKMDDIFGSPTFGGGPLILLGKKLEKEEKQKETILKKELLKNEIKKILKNYSELNEEKNFLEFLLEKL